MKAEKNVIKTVREAGDMLKKAFGKQHQLSFDKDRSGRDTLHDRRSLKIICQGLQTYYPKDGLMGEGLKELAPEIGIKLNDSGILPGTSERIWVIDPICGSIPFARGIADFIISVACFSVNPFNLLEGIVFDPILNELFYAEAGKGSFLNSQPIKVSDLATKEAIKNGGMVSIEHKMLREKEYHDATLPLLGEIGRLRVAGTCGLELAYVAAGRIDVALKARQPLYDFAAGLLILQEAGGKATDFNGSELKIEASYNKITNILASNNKIHQFIEGFFKI